MVKRLIPQSQAALFEHVVKRAQLQASFSWKQVTSVHLEIAHFRKWGWQNEDKVFGYHIGEHAKMPVRLAASFCTAAAKGLEQETVNTVELESAAQGWVHVNVDV